MRFKKKDRRRADPPTEWRAGWLPGWLAGYVCMHVCMYEKREAKKNAIFISFFSVRLLSMYSGETPVAIHRQIFMKSVSVRTDRIDQIASCRMWSRAAIHADHHGRKTLPQRLSYRQFYVTKFGKISELSSLIRRLLKCRLRACFRDCLARRNGAEKSRQ